MNLVETHVRASLTVVRLKDIPLSPFIDDRKIKFHYKITLT